MLTGVPSDLQQNALGGLRLHGALRVATRLVGALEVSLADLTIGGNAGGTENASVPEVSTTAAQDEELLKAIAEDSTTLCFVNRHLLLFERGLVIADAAVEAVSRIDGVTRQMRCQFRHFLSFSQIALLVRLYCLYFEVRHVFIPPTITVLFTLKSLQSRAVCIAIGAFLVSDLVQLAKFNANISFSRI